MSPGVKTGHKWRLEERREGLNWSERKFQEDCRVGWIRGRNWNEIKWVMRMVSETSRTTSTETGLCKDKKWQLRRSERKAECGQEVDTVVQLWRWENRDKQNIVYQKHWLEGDRQRCNTHILFLCLVIFENEKHVATQHHPVLLLQCKPKCYPM